MPPITRSCGGWTTSRPRGWCSWLPPTASGGGKRPSPRMPNSRWLIALLVVGLLALNLWISSRALQPNAPVRIPYSPTFLSQVQNGNVREISSTGDSIQGTFKNALRYPSGDKNVAPKSDFSTQVPSFANNSQLSTLL